MSKSFWSGMDGLISNQGRWEFKRLEERIRQAGHPWGITPAKYWVGKIFLPCIALGYVSWSEQMPFNVVVALTTAFFFPDIFLYSKRRDRLVAFKRELPEVVDIIELGVTADIPIDDAFLLAADTVEGGGFEKRIVAFVGQLLCYQG